MAHSIKTQIVINASDKSVWDILTDVDNYGQWNPFIRKMSGGLQAGAPIRLSIRAAKGMNIHLRANINQIEPCRYVSWSGPKIPGFFGNEHFFKIKPAGALKTLFIHGETFSGILGFFMFIVINTGFLGLYKNMNTALKHRAEASLNRSFE